MITGRAPWGWEARSAAWEEAALRRVRVGVPGLRAGSAWVVGGYWLRGRGATYAGSRSPRAPSSMAWMRMGALWKYEAPESG